MAQAISVNANNVCLHRQEVPNLGREVLPPSTCLPAIEIYGSGDIQGQDLKKLKDLSDQRNQIGEQQPWHDDRGEHSNNASEGIVRSSQLRWIRIDTLSQTHGTTVPYCLSAKQESLISEPAADCHGGLLVQRSGPMKCLPRSDIMAELRGWGLPQPSRDVSRWTSGAGLDTPFR